MTWPPRYQVSGPVGNVGLIRINMNSDDTTEQMSIIKHNILQCMSMS